MKKYTNADVHLVCKYDVFTPTTYQYPNIIAPR